MEHPLPNTQVGQLVLIHEDDSPPRQRSLARVTAVIPGQGGRVRVVVRRSINKIAPLSVEIPSVFE